MLTSVTTLIIGGGIAGISAAKTLIEAGFENVKLLEASSRLGGRIVTETIDGESDNKNMPKVDLGATYIHGVESNPIYQLADENHLLRLTQRELKHGAVLVVTEDGEEVNARVVQEVDWHYGMIMQECEDFFILHKPTVVLNDSVGDFIRREMAQYLNKYAGHDQDLRRMLLHQRLLHEAVLCGSDEGMDDVSLQDIGSYEELPGANFLIHEGFGSVINALAAPVPKESIYFNHHVKKINWETDSQQVKVVCENGRIFTADHVIVTSSLGYLKAEHQNLFDPPLPQLKTDAINQLGYGSVDKIVLVFEEELLPGDKYRRIDLLWNNDNDAEFNVKEHWHRKLCALEMITPFCIQGWLTGASAVHLESLSDRDVIEKVSTTLEQFLKHPVPRVKQLIRSSWAGHKYAKGSYTYIPIGASIADVENLSEPLPYNSDSPSLLFAGEATHPVYYSTTHGAMLTGEREARRIINIYTKSEHNVEASDSDECDGITF